MTVHYSFAPPTAAEFAMLYGETGWAEWSLETFENALAGSWVVCTARDDDGRLIGLGRLISDGAPHAFVTEMIVATAARGGGIGSEILRMLVDESRQRGVNDIQLFAARGRTAFYERHGFAPRTAEGPGMDIVAER